MSYLDPGDLCTLARTNKTAYDPRLSLYLAPIVLEY